MMGLYSYYLDCYRMGEVSGLFIASDDSIKANLGKNLYFGEILGKHSEITDKFSLENITLLSTEPDKVSWLMSLVGVNVSGYNPLDFVDECEEQEEEE